MEKTVLELRTFKNHPPNYRLLQAPYSEEDVLDLIVDWSIEHPDQKIYKHFLYPKEENRQENKEFPKKLEGFSHLCDLVYYLTIYHQQR